MLGNFCQNLRLFFKTKKNQLSVQTRLIKVRIRRFNKKNASQIGFLYKLLKFTICYGVITNYVAYVIFNFGDFSISTVIAWGLFYYLISQEFPVIVRKSKG